MANECGNITLTTNWHSVIEKCYNADVVILEGYEFSGKNTIMQALVESFPDRVVYGYRADYSLIDYTQIVSEETRFTLRLQMLELINIIQTSNTREWYNRPIFVLDRSFFSDYVYLNLSGKATENIVTQIYETYRTLLKDLNVVVVHISPDGKWLSDLSKQDEFKDKYTDIAGYNVIASRADFLYSVAFEDYKELYPEDPISFIRYIKSEGTLYEDFS